MTNEPKFCPQCSQPVRSWIGGWYCSVHHFVNPADAPVGPSTPGNLHARNTDPESSKRASRKVPRSRQTGIKWVQLAEYARAHDQGLVGLAYFQAAEAAGLSAKQQPWKRCSDLKRDKYIEVVMQEGRAVTFHNPETNEDVEVYRITEAGRQALGQT